MKKTSVIFSLFLLSGCMKSQIGKCQKVSSGGLHNIANCSYQDPSSGRKIDYDENGLIRHDYEANSKKIVLLGNELVSGENLKSPLPELIQEQLFKVGFKDYEVVNAGIRQTTTRNLSQVYELVYKKYQPNLTILLIHSDDQILRDFFNLYEHRFCPISKISQSFREPFFEKMLVNTIASIKDIQRQTDEAGGKLIVIWTGLNIRKVTMNGLMPECQSFDFIAGSKTIGGNIFIENLINSGQNIVTTSAFAIAYQDVIKEINSDENLMQLFTNQIPNIIFPWILMELD